MLNNFEAFAAHFKPTADSDQKAFTAMYNENTEDTVETEEQASAPSSDSDQNTKSSSESNDESDYDDGPGLVY